MAGARGVPVEWLDGSPFEDYFVPSVILAVVVGGSLLVAAIACFAGSRMARPATVSPAVSLEAEPSSGESDAWAAPLRARPA